MPKHDAPPEYENYTQPSITGCLIGVIAGLAFIAAAYFIAGHFLPSATAFLAAPALAMTLIVVGFGVYYYFRNRKTPEEMAAIQASQEEKREEFEDWLEEELEVKHQSPEEQSAPDSDDSDTN